MYDDDDDDDDGPITEIFDQHCTSCEIFMILFSFYQY